MRRLLCLLFLLCLIPLSAAQAEDVCTVEDASAAVHVTTDCAYLQVCCPLTEEGEVTLTVHDEWGYLIYQRNYGACSGTFRSGEVHLPLDGSACDYDVTLTTSGGEYTFTVTRKMAKVTDDAVYAGGATLKELTGGSSRKYALVLDMNALSGQTLIAPMLAGGARIGEVIFTVKDGELTVSASLTAQGQIDKAAVYIATDALTAKFLGEKSFSGIQAELNTAIELSGSPYAAVMVQLTVTYDPTTAQAWAMDKEDEEALLLLLENWELMQQTTASEAVG